MFFFGRLDIGNRVLHIARARLIHVRRPAPGILLFLCGITGTEAHNLITVLPIWLFIEPIFCFSVANPRGRAQYLGHEFF